MKILRLIYRGVPLALVLVVGALVALAADAFGRAEEWLRSEAEAMRRNLHD